MEGKKKEKKNIMQCLPVVRFNSTIFWKKQKTTKLLHGIKRCTGNKGTRNYVYA